VRHLYKCKMINAQHKNCWVGKGEGAGVEKVRMHAKFTHKATKMVYKEQNAPSN